MIGSTDARFDPGLHQYVDVSTGEIFKSATQLIVLDGMVDEDFYTEESSERGTQVHRLTLDYDLGAIDVRDCVSKYRGWLLAYDALTQVLRPTWRHLEEPFVNKPLRVAATPDRVGHIYKLISVGEIKSGERVSPKRRGDPGPHEVQTAIQAIVVAKHMNIAPEMIARWGLYIQEDGKFKVLQFIDSADLRKARSLIRKFCI